MEHFKGIANMGRFTWRGAMLGTIALLVIVGCGAINPELPIVLTYRPSLMGEGQVIQFHSEAPTRLVLNVVVTDTAGEIREAIVSIGPHDIEELGWLELGRPIEMGDTIEVLHDKYRPLEVTLE